MVSSLSVGKEVVSYCTPCKLALAHIIVTMKNEKDPGKVVCKTCNKTHAYKDPDAAKKKKKVTKKATTRALQKKKSEDFWLKVVTQSDSATHKTYSIREIFEQEDIIVHPIFGIGIVERIIDGNKLEVLFKTQEKILIHNK